MQEKIGAIVVLSGPSGSGKSSLVNTIKNSLDNYYVSISTTTRPPRDKEINGVDYFFVSKDEFLQDVQKGFFLEYAVVHGNYYGTSIKPVQTALQEKKLVLFDIDVQGHAAIKEKFPDITTSVFITTPSLLELKNRLKGRGTESDEIMQQRLNIAKEEVLHAKEYDYILVNNDFAQTANNLLDIITVAKLKRPKSEIDEFVSKWLQN